MSLLEAEYTALRSELLKRIELRQHIILATLTIAGIFLGFGVKEKDAFVTLVYPPLAAFLSLAWAQNDYRIGDLANYIRDHIEKTRQDLYWERYMQDIRGKGTRLTSLSFVILSSGGIFIFTQFMAIAIAILNYLIRKPSGFMSIERIAFIVLLSFDVILIVPVVWVLVKARNRRMEGTTE